jgi:ribosome-associated translation inhibitor RaiA
MRLHIEGKDMPIVPHLVGRIAERLEQFNSPHEDIWEARVMLVQQADGHEAQVRLLLSGTTLTVQRHGPSPDAAIGAVLRSIAEALTMRRRRRQYRSAAPLSPLRPQPSLAAAGKAGAGRARRHGGYCTAVPWHEPYTVERERSRLWQANAAFMSLAPG